jgi:hypothetical protein
MTHVRAALPVPDSSDQAVGATAAVIVVGLDGSPTSWDAFAWAAGEAIRAYGGLVVYVNLVVVGRSAKMRHHLAGSLGRRLVGRKDAPVVVVVP